MTAEKKPSKAISRREFLKTAGALAGGLFLNSLLAACTSEIEKPLIISPPLAITFNNQAFLFSELPEATQTSIKKMLAILPSIVQTGPITMVMPTEPPYNWPEGEIKPPQGELLSSLNISQVGSCHYKVPYGFGSSHFVITDNNQHLYVPTDDASYQSYANQTKARVNFDQLVVIQQLTRGLDWISVPADQQEYSLLFGTDTRFIETNNHQQHQVLLPPGCRAFLETAVKKEGISFVNPKEFSNVPLHDLEIATQVLTTLLLASERHLLIGDSTTAKQIPLFSPFQPQEAMSQVKLENVDTLGFEARDPDLERDIKAVEIAFQATCSTLPKELPLAFKIWEQRTNDKGKTESRVRLVFMQSDGNTSENWFHGPKQELHIGNTILVKQLPNEVRVALKLNEEGYQPIGIEQAQTRLFWDGEAYRIGVYNSSEANQVVFEWDDIFAINGLAKAAVGAQIGSTEDILNFKNKTSDLTDWYYALRNQGVNEVGPAGLTLPDWISKILWGMEPLDSNLTSALREEDYFFPLFTNTPLAELEEQKNALVVYLGERTNLAMTLKNGFDWRELRLRAQIKSFEGELHYGDMLPFWNRGVFWNVPGVGDLKVLRIGGNSPLEALSVPYLGPQSFSVIRGQALSKIRALFRNLQSLYDSQPALSGSALTEFPQYDPLQKKHRRQSLALHLRNLPQF